MLVGGHQDVGAAAASAVVPRATREGIGTQGKGVLFFFGLERNIED